jgi:hypothetical protein
LKNYFKKARLCCFLLFFSLVFLHGQSGESLIAGPIYSKNYYLPHLPVYSFPGFSPRSGQTGDQVLSAAYTTLNEFVVYSSEEVALDYESSILDISWQYRPADSLLLGVEGRLISYYSGLFDSVIETFHSFFGFANAGREIFDQNELYIYMDNLNGTDLILDEAVLALGDTDFFGVWTFYEESYLYLALAGALKLPTGSFDDCTGSDWVDGGVQFLGEWVFYPHLSLHFQQGFVIPGDWLGSVLFDCSSYSQNPVSQTLLGLQYTPRSDWSILTQFRINTSPVSSDKERYYVQWGTIYLFTLPQTSLLMGVKKAFGPWMVQVHFEEDSFTYEGADILAGVRLERAY